MGIRSTRDYLKAWGYWGSRINLGYPNGSTGPWRPTGYSHENPDPKILEVDKAVSHVEPEYRKILSDRYQWRLPRPDICRRYGWSTATYYRRLGEAQWAVHIVMGQ